MRNPLILSWALMAVPAGLMLAQETPPAPTPVPVPTAPVNEKELMDRVSTAYGTRFSTKLKEEGINLNIDKFAEAFRAVAEGKTPLVTDDQIDKVFAEMSEYMEGQAKAKNAEFLATNGKKQGVTTTASGLQWEVIKAGEGAKPKATDQVTVHYEGRLITGKLFDSSIERGEPATFGLDQVIPGWTEGVQLMPKGAKYRFVIPSALAYGDRGAPPEIPPGSTLVFEVELLNIGQ